MTEILAVIPARGGSKGVPCKNIRLVANKPLIAWTIESAQAANLINRVVVTTDSEAIADVGRQYGVEIPFLRPAALAQDDTPGMAPILHAVRWLDQYEDYRPDVVICLQPTSPLRTAADIDAAIELAWHKNADAVVSLTPVNHHSYWMKQVDSAGRIRDFLTLDRPVTRRQDLPPVYALNGAIYLARRDILLERESWYGDKSFAYVMPLNRSLDIDTPWDIHLADLILKDRGRHESQELIELYNGVN